MSVSLKKRELQNDPLRENRFVAEKLNEVADLLDQQRASVFRVRAFREAAEFVNELTHPLRGILEESGPSGLDALPTIGKSITRVIVELLNTGNLALIDRLRGNTGPESLFQTVPMIGRRLAKSIHDELKIDSLEGLEEAAYDGRLIEIKGVGVHRLEAIKKSLAEILGRRRPTLHRAIGKQPSVIDVLGVDRAYRAAVDHLPMINTRRPNSTGSVNLPILHTENNKWRFTAIFSNTPAAQNYKRTRDWVVIYYEQDNHAEGQCTVVTEHRGPSKGRRVIRGREAACAAYYRRNDWPN